MKLILDEDLPRDLLTEFKRNDHEAVHVEDLGWKGIRNGDLLELVPAALAALTKAGKGEATVISAHERSRGD